MSRILIVDDDELVREVVAFQLESAGHEVVSADDGEEGLHVARRESFDLVLLDSMMPRLSGVEVCRRLRDDDRTRRLPIVMLTVRSQEADIERGFAAGADDYVPKPFNPRELVSRVNAILGAAAAGERPPASAIDRHTTAISFDDLRERASSRAADAPEALRRYLEIVLQVEVAAADAGARYDDEIAALEARLDAAWRELENGRVER